VEPDAAQETWTGRRMRTEEAQEASGVEQILFADRFKSHLHRLISDGSYRKIYLDLDVLSPDQPHTWEQIFASGLRADFPQMGIDSVYPLLRRMRTYKTNEEIERLRAAVQLTGKGLAAMMKVCRPGIREYEMEAEFRYILAREGCREPAFKPIVSAGGRNFYLHYDKPFGLVGSGDLVLCDVGAAVDGYCADISRVFPADGRFSKEQCAIYEAALAGVKAAQAVGRPGCTFEAFNQAARDVVRDQLARLGLVKEADDLKKYMWHGLAHHVGLDVHDAGIYDVPFAENMLVTLDVGIYVREWNIGLRIEDDVLVRADGLENLGATAGIPKEVDEIEALLRC
jgi:Xaa-Pro aminopeptidase